MRANAAGAYSFKGRYYLADYGYIDFETTTPFDWGVCAGGQAPESGVMVITAAGGDWNLDFSVGDCAAVHVTGPGGYDEVLNWPGGDVAAP